MESIKFQRKDLKGTITFSSSKFDELSQFEVSGDWSKETLIDEINSLADSLPAHAGVMRCNIDESSPEDIDFALCQMGFTIILSAEFLAKKSQNEDEAYQVMSLGFCY
ncbi:MAG: hypothetical protein ACRC6N_11205 [Plesiomonas sp.]|uniref:hypothetical protein n=1 Tax=Plesiomonas sp. TaxID=2486279 RepID=UPI003F2A3AD0